MSAECKVAFMYNNFGINQKFYFFRCRLQMVSHTSHRVCTALCYHMHFHQVGLEILMAKERALNGLISWTGDRPMTVQHISSLSLKNLIKDYIKLKCLYLFHNQ